MGPPIPAGAHPLDAEILRRLPATRAELCAALDKARTTVFDRLDRLVGAGWVRREFVRRPRGRPWTRFVRGRRP